MDFPTHCPIVGHIFCNLKRYQFIVRVAYETVIVKTIKIKN